MDIENCLEACEGAGISLQSIVDISCHIDLKLSSVIDLFNIRLAAKREGYKLSDHQQKIMLTTLLADEV